MKKLSTQSLILLLCFLSVSFWQETPYKEYSISLIGVLAILYIFSSKIRKRHPDDDIDTHEFPTIVLLLISVLLLIIMTGGIHSLLFFLLYFLPFYLATLFNPAIVFFFALFVIGFFWGDLQTLQTETLIKLTALLLFAPVAFFMGKSLQERKQLVANETTKAKRILVDVSDILKTQSQSMDESTIAKLKDIVDTSKNLGKEQA